PISGKKLQGQTPCQIKKAPRQNLAPSVKDRDRFGAVLQELRHPAGTAKLGDYVLDYETYLPHTTYRWLAKHIALDRASYRLQRTSRLSRLVTTTLKPRAGRTACSASSAIPQISLSTSWPVGLALGSARKPDSRIRLIHRPTATCINASNAAISSPQLPAHCFRIRISRCAFGCRPSRSCAPQRKASPQNRSSAH